MPHKITLENIGHKKIEHGKQIFVLKGIDLEIECGTRVSLIGRNGSGKTTLVKILSGEFEAEKYHINKEMVAQIGAFPITQGKRKKNDSVQGVATVHQFVQDDLNDCHTILKNVHLRQRSVGISSKNLVSIPELNSDFSRYMGGVQRLSPDRKVGNLSGGQKQLLNVLIALKYGCGTNCTLLMLDEHLNSLDVIARDEVEKLIEEILKDIPSKPTVIMVTHDLEMAIEKSDVIVCLKKNGTANHLLVSELMTEHNNDKKLVINELKKIISE